MRKRIHATLYMESKIARREFVAIHDPDGYLFAGGFRPAKILPEDLPEWYVHGYMYKRHGYMSAKGVKHLLYKPNFVFDNHLHKYDSLFISYKDPIEMVECENGFTWYQGYDRALGGSAIADFVEAAGKYSDYDVREIQTEIARKREFYYERNPEHARTDCRLPAPEKFGRRLPYRGTGYLLGGVVGRKAFFDNAFCVPVNHSLEQVKQDVVQIYRNLARRDFNDRVHEYATKMGVPPGEIKINGAKTALGRCSANKHLGFSWRLVMLENDVIDYVIVCALAQLRISNRCSEYWALVESVLPDYKESQRRLKYMLERLKSEEWI